MVDVSVIVPVYNVERHIEACLESLVNQTLKNIEIIVIDDGSTDGSLEIIKRYHNKYPKKIVYESIKNGGAANARNHALKIATGEYVGFVDSDDFVALTMFEKMYKFGVDAQADIVTCGYNVINMGTRQRRDIPDKDFVGASVLKSPSLYVNSVPYVWNKLFKRTLIEEQNARFEPLRIYEDLVFTYKLFLKANKVVKMRETLYNYVYQREGSLTAVFSEKRFDIFPAFDLLIDYFKREKVFYHFEEELLFLLISHAFVVFDHPVKFTDFFRKWEFINKCFQYLNEQFPYWKSSNLYFEKRNKSKILYTKKSHWYFKSLIPFLTRKKWERFKRFKKELGFNPVGAAYLKMLNSKPVLEKRILIISQHGNNLNGNMFYILKELCNNPEYETYEIAVGYVKGKYEKYRCLLQNYSLDRANVKLIQINSKEYVEYLATAKYLFNDISFSVFFIKREEQIYLNTWHGTPLKTLGKSTAGDYYNIANLQKNFLLSDYLLYPSEYMRDCMFRDYMLEPIFKNKVLMSGYPRNEIFFAKERYEAVRQENGITDKVCIAYMPLWRGNARAVKEAQKQDVLAYLSEMDKQLTEQQILFVNLNPFIANALEYSRFKHIRPFPEKYETYEFLNACDMLITDYSSVMFDYAVTGRKIILFTYDENEYFTNRGAYVTLSELPFAKVSTVKQLIEEINNTENVDCSEFLKKFALYESQDISKRICAKVILQKDAGVLSYDYQQKTRDAAMIHLNSFSEPVVAIFKNLCEKTELTGSTSYYYTYDTADLRGNEHHMKLLPKELLYFGKLNSYSAVSLKESIALHMSKTSSRWNDFFRKMLEQVYMREKERAFGYVHFSSEIIIGKEGSKVLNYVSVQKCKKIMYLTRLHDINKNVSANIYNKFDLIIVQKEEIQAYLHQMGVNTKISVMQPNNLKELCDFK